MAQVTGLLMSQSRTATNPFLFPAVFSLAALHTNKWVMAVFYSMEYADIKT